MDLEKVAEEVFNESKLKNDQSIVVSLDSDGRTTVVYLVDSGQKISHVNPLTAPNIAEYLKSGYFVYSNGESSNRLFIERIENIGGYIEETDDTDSSKLFIGFDNNYDISGAWFNNRQDFDQAVKILENLH